MATCKQVKKEGYDIATPYGVDLGKKAIRLVEKGMSKKKISDLLGIGVVSLFRWIKRTKDGRALKASRPKGVRGY